MHRRVFVNSPSTASAALGAAAELSKPAAARAGANAPTFRRPQVMLPVPTPSPTFQHVQAGVPDTQLTREATGLLRECSTPLLLNHSHRVFFWANELGRQTGEQFDAELVFICAAFHDLGLLKKFSSATDRFEVDSANAVRQFLEHRGVPTARIQTAWDAIALHTTPGIAAYKPLEVELLYNGVALDVLGIGYETFPEDLRTSVVAQYPRVHFKQDIAKAFLEGFEHKTPSTEGTCNEDICSHFIRNYQRSNFYEQIQHSPFQDSSVCVGRVSSVHEACKRRGQLVQLPQRVTSSSSGFPQSWSKKQRSVARATRALSRRPNRIRLSGGAQGPQSGALQGLINGEDRLPIGIHVLEPCRGEMGQILFHHRISLRLELVEHGLHVHGIPDDHRIRHQVEAHRLIGLGFLLFAAYDAFIRYEEKIAQGMTPESYITWFSRLMDHYKLALNGHAEKMIYTGNASNEWAMGNFTWQAALNTASPNGGSVLVAYVRDIGGGFRHGFTEACNHFSHHPAWGTTATTIGNARYVVTDDLAPLIADPARFFGTENECFGTCEEPSLVATYYNMKMATLLMLALRMNWVFIDQDDYNLAPDVVKYSLYEMGKTVSDAPDAWVALREWYNGDDNDISYPPGSPGPSTQLRNWERWLYQREVNPDGRTVKTNPVDQGWTYNGVSYEGRRTDHVHGSDYIYFNVDDKFINGGSSNLLLKVTYLDNNTRSWWVEYDAADGNRYKRTTVIKNKNSRTWKMVTLSLPNASFLNWQTSGMDFRIYNGGRSDLSVRFVRVIKLNDPTSTTIAMMQPQSFSPQATAALTGTGVALDTMRQILATPAAHSSSTLTFISTNLNQLQTIVSRIVAVR